MKVMTTTTPTPEALAALRAELIAWELREARIYGEPLTPEQAARKVESGLAPRPRQA